MVLRYPMHCNGVTEILISCNRAVFNFYSHIVHAFSYGTQGEIPWSYTYYTLYPRRGTEILISCIRAAGCCFELPHMVLKRMAYGRSYTFLPLGTIYDTQGEEPKSGSAAAGCCVAVSASVRGPAASLAACLQLPASSYHACC